MSGQSHDRPASSDAVVYLPLVRRIARRLGRRLPGHVDDEDLAGAGTVGLLEAMKRYEPDRQVTFRAYAEFRIKGAILDELRRRDLMARDARTESKAIERGIAKLHLELGRPPEEEEIADALGVSLSTLHERLTRLAPVQITDFNEQLHRGAGGDSALDAVLRHELTDRLAAAIGLLNERQQQILYLYYQESLTLKAIGAVLAVSESRVSQILTGATLQLRSLLHDEDDDEEAFDA
jgi:RNA polymerase sigma factor FliA